MSLISGPESHDFDDMGAIDHPVHDATSHMFSVLRSACSTITSAASQRFSDISAFLTPSRWGYGLTPPAEITPVYTLVEQLEQNRSIPVDQLIPFRRAIDIFEFRFRDAISQELVRSLGQIRALISDAQEASTPLSITDENQERINTFFQQLQSFTYSNISYAGQIYTALFGLSGIFTPSTSHTPTPANFIGFIPRLTRLGPTHLLPAFQEVIRLSTAPRNTEEDRRALQQNLHSFLRDLTRADRGFESFATRAAPTAATAAAAAAGGTAPMNEHELQTLLREVLAYITSELSKDGGYLEQLSAQLQESLFGEGGIFRAATGAGSQALETLTQQVLHVITDLQTRIRTIRTEELDDGLLRAAPIEIEQTYGAFVRYFSSPSAELRADLRTQISVLLESTFGSSLHPMSTGNLRSVSQNETVSEETLLTAYEELIYIKSQQEGALLRSITSLQTLLFTPRTGLLATFRNEIDRLADLANRQTPDIDLLLVEVYNLIETGSGNLHHLSEIFSHSPLRSEQNLARLQDQILEAEGPETRKTALIAFKSALLDRKAHFAGIIPSLFAQGEQLLERASHLSRDTISHIRNVAHRESYYPSHINDALAALRSGKWGVLKEKLHQITTLLPETLPEDLRRALRHSIDAFSLTEDHESIRNLELQLERAYGASIGAVPRLIHSSIDAVYRALGMTPPTAAGSREIHFGFVEFARSFSSHLATQEDFSQFINKFDRQTLDAYRAACEELSVFPNRVESVRAIDRTALFRSMARIALERRPDRARIKRSLEQKMQQERRDLPPEGIHMLPYSCFNILDNIPVASASHNTAASAAAAAGGASSAGSHEEVFNEAEEPPRGFLGKIQELFNYGVIGAAGFSLRFVASQVEEFLSDTVLKAVESSTSLSQQEKSRISSEIRGMIAELADLIMSIAIPNDQKIDIYKATLSSISRRLDQNYSIMISGIDLPVPITPAENREIAPIEEEPTPPPHEISDFSELIHTSNAQVETLANNLAFMSVYTYINDMLFGQRDERRRIDEEIRSEFTGDPNSREFRDYLATQRPQRGYFDRQTIDDQNFYQIMNIVNAPGRSEEDRQRIFKEQMGLYIDSRTDIGAFSRWQAKHITLPLFTSKLCSVIGTVSQNMIDRLREAYESRQGDQEGGFPLKIFDNATGFLVNLRQAITTWAHNPEGDIWSFVSKEMSLPSRNGGISPKQMNGELSKFAVDRYFKGFEVSAPQRWMGACIDFTINFNLIPSEHLVARTFNRSIGRLLVGAVGSVGILITGLLRATIGIGVVISNRITAYVIKKSLVRADLIEMVKEKTRKTLYKDSPYRFAINKALLDQLKDLWNTIQLQKRFGTIDQNLARIGGFIRNEEQQHGDPEALTITNARDLLSQTWTLIQGKIPEEDRAAIGALLTRLQAMPETTAADEQRAVLSECWARMNQAYGAAKAKEQVPAAESVQTSMDGFVRNFWRVIEVSSYQDPVLLKRFLTENPGILESVKSGFENLFMPSVSDKVTKILIMISDMFKERNMIERQLGSLLSSLNDAITKNEEEPGSQDELQTRFAQTEEQVSRYLDLILESSVDEGMDDFLVNGADPQRRAAKQAVDWIRVSLLGASHGEYTPPELRRRGNLIHSWIERLAQAENPETQDRSQLIKELRREVTEFKNSLDGQIASIRSNRAIETRTKEQLLRMHQPVIRSTSIVIQNVNRLLTNLERSEAQTPIIQALDNARVRIDGVHTILQNPELANGSVESMNTIKGILRSDAVRQILLIERSIPREHRNTEALRHFTTSLRSLEDTIRQVLLYAEHYRKTSDIFAGFQRIGAAYREAVESNNTHAQRRLTSEMARLLEELRRIPHQGMFYELIKEAVSTLTAGQAATIGTRLETFTQRIQDALTTHRDVSIQKVISLRTLISDIRTLQDQASVRFQPTAAAAAAAAPSPPPPFAPTREAIHDLRAEAQRVRVLPQIDIDITRALRLPESVRQTIKTLIRADLSKKVREALRLVKNPVFYESAIQSVVLKTLHEHLSSVS